MSELFDFKNTESAKSTNYLKPGMYNLHVESVKFEQPQDKNPFINVTFASDTYGKVSEKFYITPKTQARLQYLHEKWFGKRLEKMFTSAEEVGVYFEKALLSKRVDRPVIVGGQYNEDNTKVFAGLPYTDFIVPEGQSFEEGVFEENSTRWNDVVRKSNKKNLSAGTSSAIISGGSTSPASDDTPW